MTASTHTIIFLGDLLIACAETTEAATAEAMREIQSQGLTIDGEPATADDLRVVEGVTLTNDEPEDDDSIVYSGSASGWLTDAVGKTYEYAVRAS